MTSASTRRRHKRNAALFAEWVGTPIGQRVTVTRANGETLKTITASGPKWVDGKHAMIEVEGIPGNTCLDRVTLGWNPESEAASVQQKWRRKGNEVVEAGRNGERLLMSVSVYPDGRHLAILDLAASAPDMAREIERLRTAMVHAMDDCMTALQVPGRMRDTLEVVARNLKTALEKK